MPNEVDVVSDYLDYELSSGMVITGLNCDHDITRKCDPELFAEIMAAIKAAPTDEMVEYAYEWDAERQTPHPSLTVEERQ